MDKIRGYLGRLFSIQPGEEQKTTRLFSIYFIFFLGLMWGDAARETMFLSAWPAEKLAQLFIANALLAFLMGIGYIYYAGRLSNEKFLEVIFAFMILWLLTVWVAVQFFHEPGSLTFAYFYVAYGAVRNISTVHILAFINDFYDTRSAKRAIPLILSAGIAGAMIAGFTTVVLSRTIGLYNVPLAWIAIIGICYSLLINIRRHLALDLTQIAKRQHALHTKTRASGIQNLFFGMQDIWHSSLLRWLAFASFLMVFLMNFLVFYSSQVFARVFANNPEGMFEFYGLLSGFSNVAGLLSQSILLSRLIAWFGVGAMNLVFPLLTLVAMIGITIFASFPSAVFARLDNSLFRFSLRNPMDAMLYNSVPNTIKSRARGFINGVVTPAGVLVSGLVMLFAGQPGIASLIISIIGLSGAGLYVIAMMQVRIEYGKSMTSLLAGEEITIERLSEAGAEYSDPTALQYLRKRLIETQDDNQAIILTKVLYDIEGDAAIPFLLEHTVERGNFVLLGLLDTIKVSGLDRLEYRTLCLECLQNPESQVRLSAAEMLLAWPGMSNQPGKPKLVRQALLEIIEELPQDFQETLAAILLQCGTEEQQNNARQRLEGWLATPITLAQSYTIPPGFTVLARLNDDQLPTRIQPFLRSPDLLLRWQALKTISILLEHNPDPFRSEWVKDAVESLLDDPDPAIQIATAEELADRPGSREHWSLLARQLGKPGFEVRKRSCEIISQPPRKALLRDLEASDPYLQSSAAFLLTKMGEQRAISKLVQRVEQRIRDASWLALEIIPFQDFHLAGAGLVRTMIIEEKQRVIDEIFWLLSAFSGEEQIQAVRRSLQEKDSFVQANAAEALEALLPPNLARLLRKLADGSSLERVSQAVRKELGYDLPSLEMVLARLWPMYGKRTSQPPAEIAPIYEEGWLTASAMYALIEVYEDGTSNPGGQTQMPALSDFMRRLRDSTHDPRLVVRQVAELGLERLFDKAATQG